MNTMHANEQVSKKDSFPIALISLTLGAFAIGMTEFVIMGILPNVAEDLHVSISTAGQLITGYALGVAIGAPILTILLIDFLKSFCFVYSCFYLFSEMRLLLLHLTMEF